MCDCGCVSSCKNGMDKVFTMIDGWNDNRRKRLLQGMRTSRRLVRSRYVEGVFPLHGWFGFPIWSKRVLQMGKEE